MMNMQVPARWRSAAKRLVTYERTNGLDVYVVLLLHCNGADASTTFTDSSPATPHTFTASGNAQIDTAESKFGGASGLFDGTTDFLIGDGSSEFAFGTSDFTIDLWVRLNTVGAAKSLYDGRAAAADVAPLIFINTSNQLVYFTANANRITGTTALTTGTWYHVALTRHGNDHRLSLNGVQEGSTYTAAHTYVTFANRPRIGATFDGTQSHNGWMDELRVSSGVARWTTTFTPPTAEYSAAASGDTLSIVRAQHDTEAQSHSAGDRVQTALIYDAQDPADIISDLMQTYALVPAPYITLGNWQLETTTYLGQVYSAIIPEPTAVNKLIGEIVEQAALAVWPDEINQQIRLQVLRSILTTADVYDEDSVMAGTLEVEEQPEKRLTRVEVYFGQRNPVLNLDQKENYRSSLVVEDTAAAAQYGSTVIKQIFSRWIPFGGSAIAERVAEVQLARFVTPPRNISFDLLRYSTETPILGGGYQLSAWPFQDTNGDAALVPIQVTSLKPTPDRWEVEAEEMIFAGETDPAVRTIVIDSNINNVNLQELHDSIYVPAVSGNTIICIIQEGVIVGSSSTGMPAFIVGDWVSVGSPDFSITVTVRGRIQGMGGQGGTNDPPGGDGGPGAVGGPALYTRRAISFDPQRWQRRGLGRWRRRRWH